MVKLMTDQIKAKKEPTITDFTIVVIEPVLQLPTPLPKDDYAIYTNNDLAKVSIVSPKPGKRISGRDDCNVDGQLAISNHFLQYYWAARGRRPESAAATRIKEDLKSLTTWP